MGHGPEEHLEQAEHAQHAEAAQHAAQDPFFRRVAMTMAIVAAVLACVTMLSHREHTETLRLQNEATNHHTRASDQWAYFQAKKNREYFYYVSGVILEPVAAKAENSKSLLDTAKEWQAQAQKYEQDAAKIQTEADTLTKRAEKLQEESQEAHHRADRFDIGELGIELALVLCSLAVLTKRSRFWHAGIAFGILGVVVATSAMLLR